MRARAALKSPQSTRFATFEQLRLFLNLAGNGKRGIFDQGSPKFLPRRFSPPRSTALGHAVPPPPSPLGFIAFCLLQQKCDPERGRSIVSTTQRLPSTAEAEMKRLRSSRRLLHRVKASHTSNESSAWFHRRKDTPSCHRRTPEVRARAAASFLCISLPERRISRATRRDEAGSPGSR